MFYAFAQYFPAEFETEGLCTAFFSRSSYISQCSAKVQKIIETTKHFVRFFVS